MFRTIFAIIAIALSAVACTPEAFYEGNASYTPDQMSITLDQAQNKELIEVGEVLLNPTIMDLAVEQSGIDAQEGSSLIISQLVVDEIKLGMDESASNFTYLQTLDVFAFVDGTYTSLGSLKTDDENRVFNTLYLEISGADMAALLGSEKSISIVVQPTFNQEIEEAKELTLDLRFSFDFSHEVN